MQSSRAKVLFIDGALVSEVVSTKGSSLVSETLPSSLLENPSEEAGGSIDSTGDCVLWNPYSFGVGGRECATETTSKLLPISDAPEWVDRVDRSVLLRR